MQIKESFFTRSMAFVSRSTTLGVLTGLATLSLHAQQPTAATVQPQANQPAASYLASVTPPLNLSSLSTASSIGYSSSVGAAESSSAENFIPAADLSSDATQPPPRRRYGRPRYNDSSHNSDGSAKWTVAVGGGLTIPISDTSTYYTPSWKISVGFGRQFSKKVAILAQFDYDHLGLQGSVIANQEYVYNYGCTTALQNAGDCTLVTGLGGNAHDWSFSLNPMYTFFGSDSSTGAYVIGGFGFYHKVTNFTLPEVVQSYYGYYEADQNVDHYTSNAPGVNFGLGFTHKISRFASEKLFAEVRYVYTFNSPRMGYTAANVATTTYSGYDAFPANANRTSYIPVTIGLRF